MVFVDLSVLRYALRILSVMRSGMESGCHAAFREGASGDVAAHLDCRDAIDVAGKRNGLQIEHQLQMLGPIARNTDWRQRQIAKLTVGVLLFNSCDPSFDLPDVLRVVIEARPIGGTECRFQAR